MTEKNTNAIVSAENVNINVPGEAIDKKSAELLGKAMGFAAEETGGLLGDFVGMFGDSMRARRQVNRVKILQRTQQELDTLGVAFDDIKTISPGEVERVMIAGSDADDEILQTMWAKLLASALTPNSSSNISPAISSTLAEMDGWDARAFEVIATIPPQLNDLTTRHRKAIQNFLKVNPWALKATDPGKILEDQIELRQFSVQRCELEEKLETLFPVSEKERLKTAKLNLLRLQLIEPSETDILTSSSGIGSHASLEDAIQEIHQIQQAEIQRSANASRILEDALFRHKSPPSGFQTSFMLSSFGGFLAEACGMKT